MTILPKSNRKIGEHFFDNARTIISALRGVYRLGIVMMVVMLSSFFAMSGIANASISNTRADASGTTELAGSGWLGGGGVNVYSNGNSASNDSGANCVSVSGAPGGSGCSAGSVYSGEKYQCVEMVNRLYLSKGWTTSTWWGNGNTLKNSLPSGITYQNNGSISSLNPGDVITLDDGGDGHAGIINSVSGSSVQIVNQNTVAVYSSATFSGGTLTMSGWAGYTVQGVAHAPSGGGPSTHANPGAVSWGSGRIDLFGEGTGASIFQQYFDGGSGWSGSWTIPVTGSMTSGPAVSSWGTDRLDVFARGSSGELEHGYFDTSGWGGWENLGDPSGLTIMPGTSPAAVSWGTDRIDVFIQASDGQMYQDYYTSSGWSGWVQPVPGVVGGGPAVSSWGTNRLDVFARGSAGDLVHAYFDGSWHSSLESFGDPSGVTIMPSTNVAAVSWGSGRIDVFIQATDTTMYQIYFDGSNGWSGWAQPIPGAVGSGPAVSTWGVDRLDVFARGSGGDMVHAYFDGSWHASLTSLGGGFE